MKLTAGRNISIMARHFLLNRHLFNNVKQYNDVSNALKWFRQKRLIRYRSYIIYLFSYVSKSLSVNNKAQILACHYSFLRNNFSEAYLEKLFGEGIELFKECNNDDEYTVILSSSSMLEFEGSLSLHFIVNGAKVHTLSFTVAPGKIFNIEDEAIMFISCLQRDSKQMEGTFKATKYFKDILPSVILMRVLEAMATSLNIKTCLGISARNQLSLSYESEYLKFYSIYDDFWLNNGGTLVDGNYIFSIPIPQKYILSVQQKHRSRTIKKRAKLDEIYNTSYSNISALIAA